MKNSTDYKVNVIIERQDWTVKQLEVSIIDMIKIIFNVEL